MIVEDLSFPDPKANLDYDDALLARADRHDGGACLRFWEAPDYFVVLGRTCREVDDVQGAQCRMDGIPVLRRSSGGGTVIQGPGCLNVSLVLPKVFHADIISIPGSYVFILDKMILALKELGVSAEFRPVCDLVLAGTEKKFSGNAQRRGRKFVLHHGTILYDFAIPLVSKYLKIPPKMPAYRNARPHETFITNIHVDPQALKQALIRQWS
ncbi:MAG: lipoate--protein ligase family protein [Candidatus Omnitrophica bacterium]|nr:lipoate--protein ligase family protein [Candidatus Omnitrophota bacterium]